jgi:hypothetical protein
MKFALGWIGQKNVFGVQQLDRSENAMWDRKLRWENWFKVFRVTATFLEMKFATQA